MRVNVQGSGTTLIPLHEEKVFLPSDPTIDLAVLPGIDPDVRIAAQYLAANDFIATREDLKLPGFGVGAEVMYLGLFNPHVGESRNQPVARFGRVALVPDEPVFWEDYPVRVILAEINAFGGSSGSPVFVPRTSRPQGPAVTQTARRCERGVSRRSIEVNSLKSRRRFL